jgi:hypothetical protein
MGRKQTETETTQPRSRQLYSEVDIASAQKMRRTFGNPVSPALAQYAIESGCGRMEPAHSNNGLGIQALAGYPSVESLSHEVINGKLVPLREHFAVFKSHDEMFQAYGKLVSTGTAYRGAMVYADDPDKFVAHLGRYSTTVGYTDIVIARMKKDNLYQYDVPADRPIVSAADSEISMAGLMSSVRMLQVALNKLGADPQLIVDGKFGVRTEAAVEWFQGMHGNLAVDGIPGALTCAAILDVFAKHG